MRKKPFERLLLKNTLAIALPAIAVFLVLVVLFTRYPLLAEIKCYQIEYTDRLDEELALMDAAGTLNVKYHARDLYYTGYNSVEKGKIKAAYYYSNVGGTYQFFLINTEAPENYIKERVVKGKILNDPILPASILNAYTEEGVIPKDVLDGIAGEFIISEPDYPRAYNMMVYVFFILPIVLNVCILIYTVFVTINPGIHGQARQLELYGDPDEIIEELNEELTDKLLYNEANIYITEHYLVVSYLAKTDVVLLSSVKYVSKNVIQKKHKGRKLYRLTLSTPELLFYEIDFMSEAWIDDVMERINIGGNE